MLAVAISVAAIPSNSSTPVGWASVGASVTGGNDENPVVVTSLAQLESALQTARNNTKKDANSKMTIYVKGEIEVNGYVNVQDTKNLTIYGLPGSAMVNKNRTEKAKTGIMLIKRCQNLIMRNMTFKSAGAYDIDGNDNLTLQSSEHIWVDHCDFQDGVDGNFDCNNQANYVTVTWCRFHYLIDPKAGGTGGSDDHRYSNLWGGSDTASDEGSPPFAEGYVYCETADALSKGNTGLVLEVQACIPTSAKANPSVVKSLVGFISTTNDFTVLITVCILLSESVHGEEEACCCKSSKNHFDTFHNFVLTLINFAVLKLTYKGLSVQI